MGQTIRKALRVALALVLAADLSGCVSMNVDSRKAADPKAAGGSLEVAVFDTPSKARAGVPSASNVSLDLGRLEGGREAPVQSFSGATWSLGGLQPGKYRLHLKAEELGNNEPSAPPTIRKEDIQIKAGEVARAEVVLKKFPIFTVLGVTVGVGVIAGVLAWYSNWNKGWNFHLQLAPAKKPGVTSAPGTRTGRDPGTGPTRRRAG